MISGKAEKGSEEAKKRRQAIKKVAGNICNICILFFFGIFEIFGMRLASWIRIIWSFPYLKYFYWRWQAVTQISSSSSLSVGIVPRSLSKVPSSSWRTKTSDCSQVLFSSWRTKKLMGQMCFLLASQSAFSQSCDSSQIWQIYLCIIGKLG